MYMLSLPFFTACNFPFLSSIHWPGLMKPWCITWKVFVTVSSNNIFISFLEMSPLWFSNLLWFSLISSSVWRICSSPVFTLCISSGEKGVSVKTGKPLHYKGTFFHRIIEGYVAQVCYLLFRFSIKSHKTRSYICCLCSDIVLAGRKREVFFSVSSPCLSCDRADGHDCFFYDIVLRW